MGMFTVVALLLVLCQKYVFTEAKEFTATFNNSKMNGKLYRFGLYPRSAFPRFVVPEDKVSWDVEYRQYHPLYYTAQEVFRKQFADGENVASSNIKFNDIDGDCNRCSYLGTYKVVNGYPLNPAGRTGLRGRGRLSRWGPNLLASLVATRWKRVNNGAPAVHIVTRLPILQALLVRKVGSWKWNVPVSFVNPGESIKESMRRLYFSQKVMNYTNLVSLGYTKEYLQGISKDFFLRNTNIYTGYIDRPENTDNAWVETIALQYIDKDGQGVSKIPVSQYPNNANLHVQWIDISRENSLSWLNICRMFLKKSAEISGAHW